MLRPAILALVLLAPFALGAAPVWAWASLACLLALLALVQGGLMAAGAAPGHPWPLPAWTAALLAGLAGLAVWQLTAEAPVHPLRLQLAGALDDPTAIRPSPILHHGEAHDALVRLLAVAAVAWLAAQAWRGARVGTALAAVTLAGAAVAAHGLGAHAFGIERVLWLDGPFYPTPTGPFVARGAFAAWLTLAMLAAAATLDHPGRRGPGLAVAVAWTIMATALVASGSRAGLAAALAGHLVLLALAVRGGWLESPPGRSAALALLGATGAAVVLAGLDGRFAALPTDLAHRVAVWQASLAAIAERPWTGHGLGSFPQLYELYRVPAASQPVASAHSAALEWAAEIGVPGALALGLVDAGVARALLRAPADSRATLAALPALLAMLLQGAVDPGPQVPGVALTAALLVGLGLSRTHKQVNHPGLPAAPRQHRGRRSRERPDRGTGHRASG